VRVRRFIVSSGDFCGRVYLYTFQCVDTGEEKERRLGVVLYDQSTFFAPDPTMKMVADAFAVTALTCSGRERC
jgi:hypothetical protein